MVSQRVYKPHLRPGCLPSQHKTNSMVCIFRDSLSHSVLFGHFFFTIAIFCLPIVVSNFAFLRNLCECICVSMCVCATLPFSLLVCFVFFMVF